MIEIPRRASVLPISAWSLVVILADKAALQTCAMFTMTHYHVQQSTAHQRSLMKFMHKMFFTSIAMEVLSLVKTASMQLPNGGEYPQRTTSLCSNSTRKRKLAPRRNVTFTMLGTGSKGYGHVYTWTWSRTTFTKAIREIDSNVAM